MISERQGARSDEREVLSPHSSSLSPRLIGIDASRSLRTEPTGTERYSQQIIGHMLAAHSDRLAFRLYAPAMPTAEAMHGDAPPPHDQRAVTVRALPGNRLWTHRALAWEVSRRPPHVLFVPAHVVPFLPPALLPPTVVTLHDVGYRYFPRSHTAVQRLYLELSTRWSAAAARRIIAVSRQTANDLQRFYGVPEAKIRVIHEAPMPRASAPGQDAGPAPVYARPFALYVGTIQPRKNLLRLIDAFERLTQQHHIGWDLVLAGRWGWLSEEYETACRCPGTGRPRPLPRLSARCRRGRADGEGAFLCLSILIRGFRSARTGSPNHRSGRYVRQKLCPARDRR